MGSLERAHVELVAQRAAEWIVDLPTATLTQREAFMAWLNESPVHIREFLAAAAWDDVLDDIDPEGSIDADALWAQSRAAVTPLQTSTRHTSPLQTPESLRPESQRAKFKRWHWSAAAAVLVLLGGAVGYAITEGFGTHRYSTMLGEQRILELEDGSIVHLNTHSRVAVRVSAQARDIELLEGQATFKVRHDPSRPFRVHAGATVIQAIGTQFDVYRRDKVSTTVAVLEGAVRVGTSAKPDSAQPKLTAGQSVTVHTAAKTGTKIDDTQHIDPVVVTAWQQRRLIFRDTPLAEVAAEFNRYNRLPKIVVEGEPLRSKAIWAVCDADDPASFAHSLGDDGSVEVQTSERELRILAR